MCIWKKLFMKPNFFIVGGTKSATTNISYYLNEHSKVFVSELNEPYYYCRFDVPKTFNRESMITDKKKYLDLFKKATNHQAIGEATSVYLHCPHAAAEIKKDNPESKIIIVIRNPIDKCYSSYFSYKFMNLDNRSFSEKIDIFEKQIENDEFYIFNFIEQGFFSKHIKRYQNVFSPDKIKIVFFEEYIKNVHAHIDSILEFLDISEKIELTVQPKNSYRIPKNKITELLLNSSKFRNLSTKIIPTIQRQKIGEKFFVKQTKIPEMSQDERKRLRKIYELEYQNLTIMLGKKPPWKDFL